jgi:hypothetical protein
MPSLVGTFLATVHSRNLDSRRPIRISSSHVLQPHVPSKESIESVKRLVAEHYQKERAKKGCDPGLVSRAVYGNSGLWEAKGMGYGIKDKGESECFPPLLGRTTIAISVCCCRKVKPVALSTILYYISRLIGHEYTLPES